MYPKAKPTFSYSVQQVFISVVIIYLLSEANAGPYLQRNTASPTASLNNSSISKSCLDGYKRLTVEQYSRYVDASGKPGSGMFGGNFKWFGSFSECNKQPEARYCLSSFRALIKLVPGKFQAATLQWGICAPKSCSNQDIVENLDFFLNNVSQISDVKRITRKDKVKLNCDESIDYDAGTIITIILCGCIAALCVAATAVELLIERKVLSDDNTTSKNSNGLTMENGKSEQTPLISKMKESPTKKCLTYDILNCFSLVRNVLAIFKTDVGSEDLTYLHGIRVLALFWIILGHSHPLVAFPSDNPDDVNHMFRRFLSMIFPSGVFTVDTFFVLSGLLVVYVNLRKLDKRPGKTFWLKFYFHRYWRLTPPLMFAILLVAKLAPHFGQGPLWNERKFVDSCSSYWWTNMLYINNIYPQPGGGKSCLLHTWYLSADMQLFIFSPVLILVASRFKLRVLLVLSSLLILASMIATGIVVGTQDYVPWGDLTRDTKNLFDGYPRYVYFLPYPHAQSYIIGAVLGCFLSKFPSTSFKLSLVKIAFLWMVAMASIVAFLYMPYDSLKNDPDEMSRGGRVVNAVLRYTSWSLAVIWIIFACHFGYAGLIKNILAAKFWIPLSRLNYMAYILHQTVIAVVFSNIEAPVHYTTFTLVIYYLAILVLSYACAFVVTVAVELPCSNLEPFVTGSRKK